ncbi:Fur family transcriptional regulator [Pontibacter sp. JAM-7]|uniref:Fur family transcriptional regulator n=1 Tax=Pontibacter sp. JAM-7 TaxID=3366581 RepID=UPI003AF4D01B
MASVSLAFDPNHNHSTCRKQALAKAKQLCHERKLRMTPIRELVLDTIWQSHKPLGAYELLPTLSEAGFNSAPPTVYRALEFLQEQGLVHRIALLNAFIGCPHPGAKHHCSFLICQHCGNTQELDMQAVSAQINLQAADLGFTPQQQSLEVLGLCRNCQEQQP